MIKRIKQGCIFGVKQSTNLVHFPNSDRKRNLLNKYCDKLIPSDNRCNFHKKYKARYTFSLLFKSNKLMVPN